MIGYQKERSEAEKQLPEWLRNAMDRARSGINPMANSPWPRESCAAFVNAYLPPNDPGRMIVDGQQTPGK